MVDQLFELAVPATAPLARSPDRSGAHAERPVAAARDAHDAAHHELSSTSDNPPRPFLAGQENALAAAAVSDLLTNIRSVVPSQANGSREPIRLAHSTTGPLVLYGPTGTGKTHLARGLVQVVCEQLGANSAAYLTAADYRRLLREANTANRLDEFRRWLRGLWLWAIDDIDHLATTDFLLQDLIHTLDALSLRGALAVITSARPLCGLDNLCPALVSRFAGGIVVPLAEPAESVRRALIHQAARAFNCTIDAEAAQLIAHRTSGGARELFGAVSRLAHNGSSRRHIGRDDAEESVALRSDPSPDITQIVAVVARYYSLPQKVLKSASRRRSVVEARSMVIYLARRLSRLSYQAIGRALGGRDHTTIMHSFRQLESRLPGEPALQMAVFDLERILR